jgi:hypothetical protein
MMAAVRCYPVVLTPDDNGTLLATAGVEGWLSGDADGA